MAEKGKRRSQTKVQSSKRIRGAKVRVPGKPRDRATKAPSGPSAEELHRRVSERAFYLFIERGGEHGLDLEDWLKAEATELRGLT